MPLISKQVFSQIIIIIQLWCERFYPKMLLEGLITHTFSSIYLQPASRAHMLVRSPVLFYPCFLLVMSLPKDVLSALRAFVVLYLSYLLTLY